MSDHIGANIRRLRERAGISATALAHAVGISKPFLSMIETGKRTGGDHYLLAAIARHIGCTIEDLQGTSHMESTDPHVRDAFKAVPDIRAALCDLDHDDIIPAGSGDAHRLDLDTLTGLLHTYISTAQDQGDYASVATQLPHLLKDAHYYTQGGTNPAGLDIYAHMCLLAAPILRRLGANTLHWVAAMRANRAAKILITHTDNAHTQLLLAHTWWTRAYHAISCGSYTRALDYTRAAHSILDQNHIDPVNFAAYRSRTYLLDGEIFAGLGQKGAQIEAIEQALSTVEGLQEDQRLLSGLVWAGPTDVLMWAAAQRMDGSIGAKTELIELSRNMTDAERDAIPLHRRVYLYIDTARAYLLTGEAPAAIAWLYEAEKLAPQHMHTSLVAKETLRMALTRANRSGAGELAWSFGQRMQVL